MNAASPCPAAVIRLVSSLDISMAAPLLREILDARGRDLVVKADGVRRLGAQCLQVLLAAREAWAMEGRSFSIEAPSQAFFESARLMGAADLLVLNATRETIP